MNKVTERRLEPTYEVECNGGVDNKGCTYNAMCPRSS